MPRTPQHQSHVVTDEFPVFSGKNDPTHFNLCPLPAGAQEQDMQ